jgi:hypothetical protein
MSQKITYNLSNVPGFLNYIKNSIIPDEFQKYYNVHEYSTKANEKYLIVKYNKEFLRADLISSYGLLRSVIFSNNFIVSFSPPKSLSGENFITKFPNKTDNIIAEEFIEGTMVNVFFDPKYGANGCWQIATRNTVGAEVSFYKWSKMSFNQMFFDACINNNFNIQTLNPKYCYSFILQHPENRIVIPFKNPQLYLVAVYEIIQKDDSFCVVEENMSEVKRFGLWNLTGIKFPEKYEFSSYSELIEKYASANTSYNIMGVIIKNNETGERTKFRNPIYEEVRHLRGNQPKLQYQYLSLRHSGKLPDFLKYYPEMKSEMSKFREQVHMYTNNLYSNYIACYIKKTKQLKEFPENYRTNMFKLHEYYINELRPKKIYINNTEVIKYVNNLHPSLLMYCLNYNMRKRLIDTIVADSKLNPLS